MAISILPSSSHLQNSSSLPLISPKQTMPILIPIPIPIPCRNPLLSLLSLLLSLSMIPSHASPSSTSCDPYMCGNVNISYPFYLSETSTIPSQYCGYPGMAVFCDHERTPILLTQNGNYTITDIHYHSRILSLVDTDVHYPSKPSCLRVEHNFTFVRNSLLRYTPSDANITFFFNCSPPPPNPEDPISCLGGNSYVFLSDSTELEREYPDLFYTCKDIVETPVLADNLSSSNLVNQYSMALSKGFELTWGDLESDDCKDCDQSGGHCGFDQKNDGNWAPVCFCSDGRIERYNCVWWNKIVVIIFFTIFLIMLLAKIMISSFTI